MLSFFNSDKSPIDKQTLRQILDNVMSARLKNQGLAWNGDYLWFDQPRDFIRRIFKYTLLKGETGTFTWGICLDFVPTITSSNKLQFHKTDKSVIPILFEWPEEYANAFNGGDLKGGITTHWGKGEAERSIKTLMDRYENPAFKWFEEVSSLEGVINVAEKQVGMGKSYNLHNPNPKLVLAFLYGKTAQRDKAIDMLDLLNLGSSLKDELLSRIESNG
jgi:hypothetical protein